MKIPFNGWFGTNQKGEIIALCFKNVLSEKQFNHLREWWSKLHPQMNRDKPVQ